jgi:hypothetical protein
VFAKATEDGEEGCFPHPWTTATMEATGAGLWPWDVKDMDDAVAWVKRCPNPAPGPSGIEIRPLDDGPPTEM